MLDPYTVYKGQGYSLKYIHLEFNPLKLKTYGFKIYIFFFFFKSPKIHPLSWR